MDPPGAQESILAGVIRAWGNGTLKETKIETPLWYRAARMWKEDPTTGTSRLEIVFTVSSLFISHLLLLGSSPAVHYQPFLSFT